jgi:hypothetical protein
MIYNNIVQSIVKFTLVQKDALALGLEYLDWDAHANIHELPEQDLIGPAGVGMVDEDEEFEIVFGIGASTLHDASLFKIRKIIDHLHSVMRPGMKIPYYDHATATVKSHMIILPGVTVAPMGRTEVRPVQFIEARALLNPFGASAQ